MTGLCENKPGFYPRLYGTCTVPANAMWSNHLDVYKHPSALAASGTGNLHNWLNKLELVASHRKEKKKRRGPKDVITVVSNLFAHILYLFSILICLPRMVPSLLINSL